MTDGNWCINTPAPSTLGQEDLGVSPPRGDTVSQSPCVLVPLRDKVGLFACPVTMELVPVNIPPLPAGALFTVSRGSGGTWGRKELPLLALVLLLPDSSGITSQSFRL